MPSKKKEEKYKLSLKKFKLASIKPDAVVVYIGRRRTGKSVALRDVMYTNRDMPMGIVISGSERVSPYFENFIPKSFIFDKFDETIVDNLLERQFKIKKNPEVADKRSFLILDDCMYDNSWINTEGIKNLFMNGRHYNVFFHIAMQYPIGIPPILRTNIDYAFIMREPSYDNRQRLYKNYAGKFPSFKIFCNVMDSLEDHQCLVIDNTSSSNALEDQIFWFKADLRDKFKVGTERYWKFDRENYNEFNQPEVRKNINEYRTRGGIDMKVEKLE